MMERLSGLDAFVQAAETRSFATAAQRLSLSPSAIGKAIARLEVRLGVRLFHRSTRSVTLTPEGALFLERCRRAMGELEAGEAELAQSRGAPSGRLRVSVPLLHVFFMPALTGFMAAYPDVALDMDFSDRLVDVIDEGFDVVIRAGEVTDSRLMSRVLGAFHLKLVASPAYLARRGVPEVPEDLAGHACLLHRFATSRTFERWPITRDGIDLTADLPETAIANTIDPLIDWAERGLGIACLPDLAIARELADGRLRIVLDPFVRHAGTFRLLWPASPHPSPKLRVFLEFMGQHLFAAAPAR
jgi:DNA-binding transcriptional LysR family regulator